MDLFFGLLLSCRDPGSAGPRSTDTPAVASGATGETGAPSDSATPTEGAEVLVSGVVDGQERPCLYGVGVETGTARALYCPPAGEADDPAYVAFFGEARTDLGVMPLGVSRPAGDATVLDAILVDLGSGVATTRWSTEAEASQILDVEPIDDASVAVLYREDLDYELVLCTDVCSVVWTGSDYRPAIAAGPGAVVVVAGFDAVRIGVDGATTPIDIDRQAVGVTALRDGWVIAQWVETGAHESVMVSTVDATGAVVAHTDPDWGQYEWAVPQVLERATGELLLHLNGRLYVWSGLPGDPVRGLPGRTGVASLVLDAQDLPLMVVGREAVVLQDDAYVSWCQAPGERVLRGASWSTTGGHAVVGYDRGQPRASLLRCDADGGQADLSVLSGVTGALLGWRDGGWLRGGDRLE